MTYNLGSLDPKDGHAPWRCSLTTYERVLHVHLRTDDEPQTSLCDALANLGEYRQVDWRKLGASTNRVTQELASDFRPTLTFMQLQTQGVVNRATVDACRQRPGDMVVTWCGDLGRDNIPGGKSGPWLKELDVDLALFTSLDQVRAWREVGVPAAYLQIGYDTDRYVNHNAPFGRVQPRQPGIAFLGQNYVDSFWDDACPGHEAPLRREAVHALSSIHNPYPLKLYGQNWGNVPYARPPQDAAIYNAYQLALSISLTSKAELYSSDRLLRALACGPVVFVKQFAGMGSWGLVDESNCFVWYTAKDLVFRLHELGLWPTAVLTEIGDRGATLARTHHTWDVRMQELAPYLRALRNQALTLDRPW